MLRKYLLRHDKSVLLCSGILICYWILWWMNTMEFQAFCRPVQWAGILLVLSAGAFAFHVFNLPPWLSVPIWFFNGIFIWISFYSVVFMYSSEFFWLGVVFLNVLVLSPALPIVWLFRNYIRLDNVEQRRAFRLGLIVPVFVLIIGAIFYLMAYYRIKEMKMTHNYWEERIEGMHFKYHTRLCLYDGWRPPLHDPLLVIYNTIIGDPLKDKTLSERIRFYHSQFPDLPLRLDCPCSYIPDAQGYLNDPVLSPR